MTSCALSFYPPQNLRSKQPVHFLKRARELTMTFLFSVPPENQLYVGWTAPGEWSNITVQVDRAGVYTADLLYTSNRGGTISLDVNGKDATGPLTIPTTFNASDPIAWRQWH